MQNKMTSAEASYENFGVYLAGERVEQLHDKQMSGKNVLEDPQFIKSLATLEGLLKESKLGTFDLRVKTGRDALRAKLLAIYDGSMLQNETPDDFTGFCGFSTIQGYLATIGYLDDGEQPLVVKGRIRDWFYNNDFLTGHLSVDVWIDYSRRVGGQRVPTKREILHWDIVVENDNLDDPDTGYKVVNRRGPESINNTDPFPGTIRLPEAALDPSDGDSIWKRGLDHKLFARGKSIVVRNVYRKIDDGPIKRLDDRHAFYKMTRCSCIDIMFKGHPPALELPEQRSYCLGRCDHPPIVNSR